MHRTLPILIFLLVSSQAFPQELPASRRTSHYTYIFRITNDEARAVYRRGMDKVTESYFRSAVDSFPTDQRYTGKLPIGRYLFAYAAGDELVYELQSVNHLFIKTLNNKTDLAIHLHDSLGRNVPDAVVEIKNRRVPYNAPTHSYRLRNTNRRGLLAVTYQGFTSYHSLDVQFRTTRLKRIVFRVLYAVPIRYAWTPFRDVYQSIRYWSATGVIRKVANLFDSYQREDRQQRRYRGFIMFNKPRYQPRDTVKLKAVVFRRRGKPVRREMELWVSGYQEIRLTTLPASRRGTYAYEFPLADTLPLQLDTDVEISLRNANGKVYQKGDFRYADYELKANTFKIRTDHDAHYSAEPQAVYAKGTDENDLNIPDARVQLTVLPGIVRQLPSERVFVPDTLWTYEQPLDAVGETKIALPDSIFPPVSLDYTIEAVFLNASNERHTEHLERTYWHRNEKLQIRLQQDTLLAIYEQAGKSSGKMASFTALDEKGDTLFARPVRLPFREIVNPYVAQYVVQMDSLRQTLIVANESAQLQCLTYRTKDSVYVQVENPRQLPFWYTVYRKNARLTSGFSTELSYEARVTTSKNYFVSLQYVWNGTVHEEEYTIPFAGRQLQIQVTQPLVVQPGQTVRTEIAVTDAQGKPAPDVDLTAYALTKKFPEAAAPEVPSFSRQYRSRKHLNSFHLKDRFEHDEPESSHKLDWPEWNNRMGLDSIAYYRFLYPKNGLYRYAMPVRDSLTQIAPFAVKNGAVLPLNMFYVDEKPVYFRLNGVGERYSFPVDSGYHTLKLRTHQYLVQMDSVYVPHGQKLILSVDVQRAQPRVRVDSLKTPVSETELQTLNRYVLPVRPLSSSDYAYLKQEKRLFPVNLGVNQTNTLIGPVSPNLAQFVEVGAYRTDFTFETGYSYEFREGLLKMRSHPPLKNYWFPWTAKLMPNFRELAWTEAEMDSLWRRAHEMKTYHITHYDNPKTTDYAHGKLMLHAIQYPKKRQLGIKHILLFNENDPDFLRVYPGDTRTLQQLATGTYKAVLLLHYNHYATHSQITIFPNGTTYLNFRADSLHLPDAVSERLDSLVRELVIETVYTLPEYERRMQEIKETYHQTYNVTTPQVVPSDFSHLVRGRLTDAQTGEGLPGVNVMVKGSRIGTNTDTNGEYSLYTPLNGVLLFSFIGYIPEEVLIGARAYIDAEMRGDIQSLQEVVVVGYSVQSKRELTGSVTVQTLQGRVAGVMVRGNNSVGGAAKPLVIVDGVPFAGNLSDLDPATIAKTETLRGEAAVALYGNRATGGAVLVTTKKFQANNRQNPLDNLLNGQAQAGSLRNRFSDYAYWQPSLMTDRNGRAAFETTFPDDVTNWRTFVAAVGSRKRTGVAEGSVKSFKSVAGNLAVPRFLVQGDSAQVIGKTLNYTSDTLDVTTVFEVNGTEISRNPARVIHSQIDSTVITATSLDSVQVKYFVRQADGSVDGELRPVPVYRKGVTETTGTFLSLSNDTTVTLRFDPTKGAVKLYAQADVLSVLIAEIDHVRNYEYVCNEQAASKLIALLTEKRIRTHLNQLFKRDTEVVKLIRRLQEAQQQAGYWGWWPDSPFSAWISLHVADALAQAATAGYAVRLDQQKLIDYLVYQLEMEKPSLGDKLRLLQLLHRLKAPVDYPKYVREMPKKMPFGEFLQLMELKQAVHLPYDVDTLLKRKQETLFGNWFWGEESYDVLYSDITATLTAYRILRQKGGYESELTNIRNFFLEKRSNGYWRNTYESALILETILPDLLSGDKAIRPSALQLRGAVTASVSKFPYEIRLTSGDSLTIRKTGNLPLYLTTYQQFWNETPEKVERDLVVKTSFENGGSETVTFQSGKPVKMVVEVDVKKEAEYVLIDVPIPAGCSYEEKGERNAWEVHREQFRHKTSLFCTQLPVGKHRFTVHLLPRYDGVYTLNPAKAELMYFPVFFGRNEAKRVRVD